MIKGIANVKTFIIANNSNFGSMFNRRIRRRLDIWKEYEIIVKKKIKLYKLKELSILFNSGLKPMIIMSGERINNKFVFEFSIREKKSLNIIKIPIDKTRRIERKRNLTNKAL